MKISTGDLFRGSLDVGKILQDTQSDTLDFRRDKTEGASDVLVKVLSTTVHHILITPERAYNALEKLLDVADIGLVNEIGSVLQAIVPLEPPHVIIVMNDLTKMGYKPLKPIDNTDQLDVLWNGFQDLVVRVLLPLARLQIVHAGICPGFDETSSILCKFRMENGKIIQAFLKLINLESLVKFKFFRSTDLDRRYIEKEVGWDATTYLWWQCMAVAYVWKESLNTESLTQDLSLDHLKLCLLYDMDGPAWLHKYRERTRGGQNLSEDDLKSTLKDLAAEFLSQPKQAT